MVLSRSRSVTVPSVREEKSTVTAKGTPISSVREYRLPMVAEDVSTCARGQKRSGGRIRESRDAPGARRKRGMRLRPTARARGERPERV